MKKVFYAFALLAVVAAAFAGCKKDDSNKDEDKVVKRLTHFIVYWDGVADDTKCDDFTITYNADGKIAAITRPDRSWTFTYEGKKITAAYVKEGEAKDPYVFTLGDNGYVSTYTDTWGDVRNCKYDKDGHLTQVDKAGEVKSNLVWENGNLVKFSRFEGGAEEYKIQSFKEDKNVGNVFPDCDDKAGIDRWMFEIGLFGKASVNLLDEAQWENSDKSATQAYEMDADGFVTKVDKVYNEKHEFVGYKWEDVK